MSWVHPVNDLAAWRDRLAGRAVFDRSAADLAIRQAYQDAGLDPPARILWADGPNEALQAVSFLRTPPRRMRRFALALTVSGCAVWIGLTLVVAANAAASATTEVVTFATTFSAFGIVVGSLRPVPLPPKPPPRKRSEDVFARLGALGVLAAQLAYSYALLHVGGLSAPFGLIAALLIAAILGALPGLLLFWRLDRAYSGLPEWLREIGPYAPVGWQLQRARDSAWAPLRRRLGLAGWAEPLPTRSRHNAHIVAFRDNMAGVFVPGAGPNALNLNDRRGPRPLLEWLARLFEPDAVSGSAPHHLDGVEDAPRAWAIVGAGATGPAVTFAQLAFHLDRLYPFRQVAVAVRLASKVSLDVMDRLHSSDGPALVWPDGTGVYVWHGQPVDASLIEDTTPLTRSRIGLETDPSRRSVLIERYGLGRYMLQSGAIEYQRDECGALYRLDQRLDEPIVAVRVVNSTPEPDGSFHEYWLRIPPATQTAREAVAWTFGLSPDEYDPVLQS